MPPVIFDLKLAGSTLAQFIKFAGVGGVASVVHVATFLGLSGLTGLSALYANFVAFLCAFVVSFVGHFSWTFRTSIERDRRTTGRMLVKFLVVALIGLALNSVLVLGIVDALGQSRALAAALMLTIVPASTFLLSRHWAFS